MTTPNADNRIANDRNANDERASNDAASNESGINGTAKDSADQSARARDRAVVAAILDGDAAVFEQLYQTTSRRIYAYALRRLGDPTEAEDVTQDVFLEIHRSLAGYRGDSSLLTWMFGIAHNQVCRRFRRKSLPLVSIDEPTLPEPRAAVAPADRRVDALRVLDDCSRTLSTEVAEVHREIFRMRYADNYSMRAIALELGKSCQAVKISLFRTRRTLERAAERLPEVLAA